MESARCKLYGPMLTILIIATMFRGIINNFILLDNGTLVVDICVITVILLTFTCRKMKLNRIMRHYFFWIVLCLMNLFVQLMVDRTPLRDGILAFRNDAVYTFPFVFVIFCIDRKDFYKIYALIRNLAFAVNVFAIFQFLFRKVLPIRFLVLNGEPTFGFLGTDAIRVTGLMGNTIVYGGFVVLVLAFLWAEILVRGFKTPLLWVQFIVAIAANLLTFNRASNAGMILVIVLEYILSVPRRKVVTALKRYVVLLIVAALAIVIIWNYFGESIIMQRYFTKDDILNANSDAGHLKMIERAVTNIERYPIIGYGAGSTGYSAAVGNRNVIADGTFWIYLLEWGIPVCIIYWLLVARIIRMAFAHRQGSNPFLSAISIGYIGANAYLIGASIINSAYSARCTLIFLWIYTGMLVKETLGQETSCPKGVYENVYRSA